MRPAVTVKVTKTPLDLSMCPRVRHRAAFIGAAARRYKVRSDDGRGDFRCSKNDRAPMTAIANSPNAVAGIVARVLATLSVQTKARKMTWETKMEM